MCHYGEFEFDMNQMSLAVEMQWTNRYISIIIMIVERTFYTHTIVNVGGNGSGGGDGGVGKRVLCSPYVI